MCDSAAPTARVLCHLDDIADPGARGFRAPVGGEPRSLFVVRRGRTVYGYVNSCPHTGVALEWVPDRFLDPDGELIVCAMHGALFRIEDGVCIAGPCAGDSLRPVPVEVTRDGSIVTLA